MQVEAILFRWLDVLASLAAEIQLAWRLRRSVIVTQEDTRFVVRRSGAGVGSLIADVPAGTQISSKVAEALRNHFLIFELTQDNIVVRRLKIPAQAREFAAGIVGNQLDRLSPWPLSQSVYGFEAAASPDDAAMLDISVFIVSRANLDAAREALAASGLAPSQVSVKTGSDASASRVPVWTGAASTAPQGIRNLPKLIGIGVMAMILLSAAISFWAAYSANALQGDYDETAARSDTLRQEEEMRRRPRSLASLNPAERAWALKTTSPAAVLIIDELTRAIPDGAYLTQLRLEKTELRIVGQAADPPSLIAALTRSKNFSDVRFFSPTIRSEDGERYEFSIAAHVVPRAGL
jgi:general secretion pathway protein L